MIEYVYADDVEALARDIVYTLHDYLGYIDMTRLRFIRSYGSRTSAVARIHALPSIWRFVLALDPIYVIEVISEKFDNLSRREKIKTIIHELLHIPPRFTGGLRPHGKYVNQRIVDKLYRLYMKRVRERRNKYLDLI